MRMDQAGHNREVTHNHELRSGDQHASSGRAEGSVQEGNEGTSATSAATTPSQPKAVPVRASTRVSKKVKLDFTTAAAPPPPKIAKKDKDEDTSESKQAHVATPETKQRKWELWSIEDINTFFEALNEYGKDFDAIQAHFASKCKKAKSNELKAEPKNKEQIRHFYYRNWHKIAKFVNFSVDLNKKIQELYALINYGELRKRIGRSILDKNIMVKLQELVYQGFTVIKIRGNKTVRVKTPVCRALRKINMMDQRNAEIPKLPPRVTVELRPLNNEAWGLVQSTAQNPRVRISLPLHHRLSTFMLNMQHRWSSRDSKLLQKLAPGVHDPSPGLRLRMKPREGSRIAVLSVNVNDILTSTSLSLQTYEDRFLGNGFIERVVPPGNKKKGKKKAAEPDKKAVVKETKEETEEKQNLDQIHAKTVDKILSLQLAGDDATDGDLNVTPMNIDLEEIKPVQEEPSKTDTREEELATCVAKIKAGWTKDDANTLTLGELYIMCGSDGKLLFDYEWEKVPLLPITTNSPGQDAPSTSTSQVPATKGSPKSVVAGPPQETVVQLPAGQAPVIPSTEAAIPAADQSTSPSNPDVANLLKKLLSLARILPLIKEKKPPVVAKPQVQIQTIKKCSCGHVCGKPAPPRPPPKQRAPKATKANSEAKAATPKVTVPKAPKVPQPNTIELPPGTTMAFQPSPGPISYQSLQDGVFRRPLLAPSHTHPGATAAEEAFKAQLDKFRPKYCNRRGRTVRKNVVVQRMMPLLPKTINGAPSMLTLKVMPQGINGHTASARVLSFTSVPVVNTAPSLVVPVVTSQPGSVPGPSLANKRPIAAAPASSPAPTLVPAPTESPTPIPPTPVPVSKTSVDTAASNGTMSASAVTPSPVAPPSPPSITALLGLGTEDLSLGADSTTLLDVPLANNPPNFVGLLNTEESSIPDPCSLLQSGNTTPPISPTRILRESDNQWLNSEVADFSLSSFLGHLDSPMKTTTNPTTVAPDDTRLSQDVEAQLQCLMSESSVDYMAKFADLAAQIASDATTKK